MKFQISAALLAAAVLASCLNWAGVASAQSSSALNVVATSGKQRMLSQRVLKAYAQWSLDVLPEKATAVMAASFAELKKGNGALREQAKDSNSGAVQAQAALIDKLASATAATPNATSLQQVLQISEELLANAEGVTQAFIKSGAEAPAAMVNLAARQRMLSQRAAGHFLAYQTAIKTPELKARTMKALSDFKATMAAFEDAKAEFPQIADRLDTARIQMVFFENALSNIDNPAKEQFTTVATTSERILGEMDLMTADIVKQLAARNATQPAPAKKP
jgi:hypothetical protein